MEDDDSKIRRNLVMFSAGIILVAWLDLPVASVIESSIKSAPVHVSSWKAWSSAIVILAYLALRFRFSEDGIALLTELERGVPASRKIVLQDRIRTSFTRGFSAQRWPHAAMHERMRAAIDQHLAARADTRPDWDGMKLDAVASEMLDNKRAAIGFRLMSIHKQHAFGTDGRIEVPVALTARLYATVKVLWWTFLYSRKALWGTLPALLAITALVVATYKLAASLFA